MVVFEFKKSINVNDIRFLFELSNPEYWVEINNPMPVCPDLETGKVEERICVINDTTILALCKRYFGDSLCRDDAKMIMENLMFDNMVDVIDRTSPTTQEIMSANLASYRIFTIDDRWYITPPNIVFIECLKTKTQYGTCRKVELTDILSLLDVDRTTFDRIDAPNILMDI